ncbi:sensor histidine kinase [Roseateles violae]|uniref:histidine kinase n=1 Tax=Roseateles violae TaxID=3058042 RepID=A0ABT8DW20_9BURK|nr:sensor histidine kinase [Pelomonas sp. PFR6]MDN3921240.1 sensor histidine kinase [Pelomonas sp. PFR6]
MPAGSFALYRLMHDTAVSWLDLGLGDTALAISNFIRTHDGELLVEVSGQTDRALRFDRVDHIYYLVLAPEGQALLGDRQLAGPQIELGAGDWNFRDIELGGETLRLVSLGVACGVVGNVCQVRVAETTGKRVALRRELMLAVLVTMLVLSAGLVLAGRLAIQQGLRPLGELSAEVEQRDLDRLEPLSQPVPAEVGPLIAALNRLFERLRLAASGQQEFLSNAAHQLRTPLTSLRTEIDLALLEPHDAAVEPLLKRLQTSVDRSARLAQQMLSMARADAALPQDPQRELDLRDIAAEAAEDWVPRAVAAGQDLGFELQPAPVLGQGFLLRELLANLIHNSLSYAGEGARVTVRTGQREGRALLEVEDTGPGIPAALHHQMLRRFQRGPAASGNGSGLGLAIAHDIAARHGGSLSLHAGAQGQGLRVQLLLPLLTPPAASVQSGESAA